MSKNNPQYLGSASCEVADYLSLLLAANSAMSTEHVSQYRTAGGPHLAIRRTLKMKAPFEAGCSGFLSTKRWPFSERAT
jgi:hypothetical protein